MNWKVSFIPEARWDLMTIEESQQLLIRKAIAKVSANPLPQNKGGYGKPLGSKNASDLSGFLKIKLKSSGLRVVYKLIRTGNEMIIVIIGVRDSNKVYSEAAARIKKHDL
ncbi:MAG: type II toxin-antitoxin system RelE/ParE family toxin [Oscillospiraceae bacterium]|nr:type II toxin-antitoxin system RelE/ParE family toxin [Oscillospiraceae bacterium]